MEFRNENERLRAIYCGKIKSDIEYKEINYQSFMNKEILELAGYRVENIEDYSQIAVFDQETGEELELSHVEYDYQEFTSKNNKDGKSGKRILIKNTGNVVFDLEDGTYVKAYAGINEKGNKGFYYDFEVKVSDSCIDPYHAMYLSGAHCVKTNGLGFIELSREAEEYVMLELRPIEAEVASSKFDEKIPIEDCSVEKFTGYFEQAIKLMNFPKYNEEVKRSFEKVLALIMKCIEIYSKELLDHYVDSKDDIIEAYENDRKAAYEEAKQTYENKSIAIDKEIKIVEDYLASIAPIKK